MFPNMLRLEYLQDNEPQGKFCYKKPSLPKISGRKDKSSASSIKLKMMPVQKCYWHGKIKNHIFHRNFQVNV